MISLTFTVDNLSQILEVFDRIQILKYIGTGTPQTPVDISEFTTVSGIDVISDVEGTSEIILLPSYSQYYFTEIEGLPTDWYTSRYYSSTNGTTSAWVDPVLGSPGDIFYDPSYPDEVSYGTEDQLILDRIRLLIGDPKGLNREFGEAAESSIHADGKTYEFDEKGWPSFINMNGTQYSNTDDPTVNGYKFLRFNDFIDVPIYTVTGTRTIQEGVDIWYYTFRWSDREIMEAYDNTPPPPPLSTTTANSEIYMLACAYDLLSSETWLYLTEDGAKLADEGSRYDPTPGMELRDDMLDKLRKRLDDAIKSVMLSGITGVLID